MSLQHTWYECTHFLSSWIPPNQQQSWIKPQRRGYRKPARIYPRMAHTPQTILMLHLIPSKTPIIFPIRERLLYDGGSSPSPHPHPAGQWPYQKTINSFDAVLHRQENSSHKRFLLIVRCGSPFMRLAQHLTALGDWYIQAISAWSVKIRHDMLRPSIVGMRGSSVMRLRPCMT